LFSRRPVPDGGVYEGVGKWVQGLEMDAVHQAPGSVRQSMFFGDSVDGLESHHVRRIWWYCSFEVGLHDDGVVMSKVFQSNEFVLHSACHGVKDFVVFLSLVFCRRFFRVPCVSTVDVICVWCAFDHHHVVCFSFRRSWLQEHIHKFLVDSQASVAEQKVDVSMSHEIHAQDHLERFVSTEGFHVDDDNWVLVHLFLESDLHLVDANDLERMSGGHRDDRVWSRDKSLQQFFRCPILAGVLEFLSNQ
jgi:hypothetical protein